MEMIADIPQIPNDLVVSILKLLSPKEIAKSRRVCKLWSKLIEANDNQLFREPTLNEFGIEEFYQNFNNWRILYSKASICNLSGLWQVNAFRNAEVASKPKESASYYMYLKHDRKRGKITGGGTIGDSGNPSDFRIGGEFQKKGLAFNFQIYWIDIGKSTAKVKTRLAPNRIELKGEWENNTWDFGVLEALPVPSLNFDVNFFQVLPLEVISCIFHSFDAPNFLHLRLVCKLFRFFVKSYMDWKGPCKKLGFEPATFSVYVQQKRVRTVHRKFYELYNETWTIPDDFTPQEKIYWQSKLFKIERWRARGKKEADFPFKEFKAMSLYNLEHLLNPSHGISESLLKRLGLLKMYLKYRGAKAKAEEI